MAGYAPYSEPPTQIIAEHDSDTHVESDSNHDSQIVRQRQKTQKEEGEKQDQEKKDDGGEEGGKSSKPPTPVGFWDHRLAHVRKEAMLKWLLTTVVLMCFILAVLSICKGDSNSLFRKALTYAKTGQRSSMHLQDSTSSAYTSSISMDRPLMTRTRQLLGR